MTSSTEKKTRPIQSPSPDAEQLLLEGLGSASIFAKQSPGLATASKEATTWAWSGDVWWGIMNAPFF
jgi:hypothetical protein